MFFLSKKVDNLKNSCIFVANQVLKIKKHNHGIFQRRLFKQRAIRARFRKSLNDH